MKVIACTVSSDGCGCPERNEARYEVGQRALEWASEHRADLVVFPAGYLSAGSKPRIEQASFPLIEAARRCGICVCFGVDVVTGGKNSQKRKSKSAANSRLANFAVGYSTVTGIVGRWRQRSATSKDFVQGGIPAYKQLRVVRTQRGCASVLICGEVFNRHIEHALKEHACELSCVVDLAHLSRGFRIWHAFGRLAEGGLPCYCSVHADRRGAMKHCCLPGCGRRSTRCTDYVIEGPPRMELKRWGACGERS